MRQVVLDTETTGLDWRSGHRVIEIGCIEVVNRRVTGEWFQAHVNPHREVDPEAYAVHGLSNEFLRDQPDFSEIAQAWFAFVQGAELVIHNAEFDVGFLNAEIKLLPDPSKLLQDMCEIHDTLDLAPSGSAQQLGCTKPSVWRRWARSHPSWRLARCADSCRCVSCDDRWANNVAL